ncbi:MAG: RNA polymerase sigma factor [Pseudomonadota bacterium]
MIKRTERLDSIVRQHYASVYRLALSMTGRPADAEDVTQEVFVAVTKGIDSFRGDAALSTWIYRIAIRTAVRWRAKQVTTESLPETLPAQNVAVPIDLIKALNALPADARLVIALVAIEGLTHAEASDILAIPEGTVASRLHYARKKLSEKLSLTD